MSIHITTRAKYIAADGSSPVVVTNMGASTLYYGPQTVTTSSYDGSLTAGASTTLTTGKWFLSATDGRIVLDTGASNDPISGSQRAALDAATSPSENNGFVTASGVPFVTPEDYGAVGDGVTDDRVAMQAAIDAVGVAGGGVVGLDRRRTYKVTSTARTTLLNGSSYNGYADPTAHDGHALLVAYDNVTIATIGGGRAKIDHYGEDGDDPTTSWQVSNGHPWRGGGIYVAAGVTGFALRWVELDGNATYTGDSTIPADAVTGDGWDPTHRGVWFENDGAHDNSTIEHCHLHNYRGEIVYFGGTTALGGKFTLSHSELNDTNGDCWSVSGHVRMTDNYLHTAASYGVEDFYGDAPAVYQNNTVQDCVLGGFSYSINTAESEPRGPLLVSGNVFDNCARYGVYLLGARNAKVLNNVFVDCGQTTYSSGALTSATTTNKPTRDLEIVGNTFWANQANCHHAIHVSDSGAIGQSGIKVTDNHTGLTSAGSAGGKAWTYSYDFVYLTDTSAIIKRNTAVGTTANTTALMHKSEQLLANTGANTVAQFRPDHTTNFMVAVYLRVVTGATDCTVSIEWYDGSGTKQTYAMLATTSEAVGPVLLNPIFVNANGDSGHTMKVIVTAGTANRVYVSTTIQEVA